MTITCINTNPLHWYHNSRWPLIIGYLVDYHNITSSINRNPLQYHKSITLLPIHNTKQKIKPATPTPTPTTTPVERSTTKGIWSTTL